jgi:hypothetical protein
MRKRDARMLLVASFGRRFDIAIETQDRAEMWRLVLWCEEQGLVNCALKARRALAD